MKKLLCVTLIILTFYGGVFGCAKSSGNTSQSSTYVDRVSSVASKAALSVADFGSITYKTPMTWAKKAGPDNQTIYYYPDHGGSVVVSKMPDIEDFKIERDSEALLNGFFSIFDQHEVTEKQEFVVGVYPALKVKYKTVLDGDECLGVLALFGYKQDVFFASYTDIDSPNFNADEFNAFLSSIRYTNVTSSETSAPSSQSAPKPNTNSSSKTPSPKPQSSAAPSAPPPSTPSITASQKNAVEMAKSYLNYSAFSFEGLISQLEYEKFSRADATYGADHCGANWNQQAVKSAKEYLNYSAFSYQGLVDQLVYEKFTTSQAKYGADQCGADWNAQAVKAAKEYLEYSSFSRDGLIAQLEYEGFTHAQAVHGVEANGL